MARVNFKNFTPRPKPKKRPRHKGIKTSEKGINTLKLSSKVSE